jgi:hypothetical protein
MNTKLLYVLTTSDEDTYYESALISIFSAKHNMQNCRISLLVDDRTDIVLEKRGMQLMQFVSEKIVVKFGRSISQEIRSRLLKTNMRNHVKGNFLYLDCDTLIADSLEDIDNINTPIAAVIDGHTSLQNHPVIDIFKRQNHSFKYPFNEVEQYFNSGVMFAMDCAEAKDFFSAWHKNYRAGLKEGVTQDQPSLSKTNYESNSVIKELSGNWNCQIRLGAKYLKNLRILHLVSKRNMPISILGDKKFLQKLKQEGLTEENKQLIINYEDTFYEPMGVVVNDDMHFNFTPLYEDVRRFYVSTNKSYLENTYRIHNSIFHECPENKVTKIIYKINKAILKFELSLIKIFNK